MCGTVPPEEVVGRQSDHDEGGFAFFSIRLTLHPGRERSERKGSLVQRELSRLRD